MSSGDVLFGSLGFSITISSFKISALTALSCALPFLKVPLPQFDFFGMMINVGAALLAELQLLVDLEVWFMSRKGK